MRRQTKKVSGPALGRYLRRFFAGEPGLPPETAESLAARGSATFSSVRVRERPLAVARSHGRTPPPSQHAHSQPAPASQQTSTLAAATPSAPAAAPPLAEFDAYAIGLVPTFQREGRDGLVARLGEIASTDNLRKMARAQQIGLPEAMRQGEVPAEALRAAIADAVGKRIADRKAAAG